VLLVVLLVKNPQMESRSGSSVASGKQSLSSSRFRKVFVESSKL